MRAVGPQGLWSVISFKVQTVRHICARSACCARQARAKSRLRATTLRARRRGSERTTHFTCRKSRSVHLSAVVISNLNV